VSVPHEQKGFLMDGRYKNGELYKELLIPYLEDLHKKQVEQGLTGDGPDPEWKYPY
jgi:hypothetical protein